MRLVQIYKCLCDETRLRILHLLLQGPLCVCHFQEILAAPQVAISKHLAYLRAHKLASSARREQWMIYSLAVPSSRELDLQLRCLQDCVQSNPIFKADLKRLKKIRADCGWLVEGRQRAPARKNHSQRSPRETTPCC